MKPFTLTVLGEALALVTTPGILEWQNCGVLMLTNRRQNSSLCGQRAWIFNQLGSLPGTSANPAPGKELCPSQHSQAMVLLDMSSSQSQ